jgi:hypothetical protein
VPRLRTILVTHFCLEIGDGRAEAIEPRLFEAVEPGALECPLVAAEASLEPGRVALRFGQGKLALALFVTLEDGEQFACLDVLPLGDSHLFHAHARPGPDHDRSRFRLQCARARTSEWATGLAGLRAVWASAGAPAAGPTTASARATARHRLITRDMVVDSNCSSPDGGAALRFECIIIVMSSIGKSRDRTGRRSHASGALQPLQRLSGSRPPLDWPRGWRYRDGGRGRCKAL